MKHFNTHFPLTPLLPPKTKRFGALLCLLSTGTALLLACIDQSHRTETAAAPYQEEEAETARRLQQQGEYYKPRTAADAEGSVHHHRELLLFGWGIFCVGGWGTERERERPINIYIYKQTSHIHDTHPFHPPTPT